MKILKFYKSVNVLCSLFCEILNKCMNIYIHKNSYTSYHIHRRLRIFVLIVILIIALLCFSRHYSSVHRLLCCHLTPFFFMWIQMTKTKKFFLLHMFTLFIHMLKTIHSLTYTLTCLIISLTLKLFHFFFVKRVFVLWE